MDPNETSTYGKKPLWQWVLIYGVIGVILYGLFYYFVLYKSPAQKVTQTDQIQTSQPSAATTSSQTSPSTETEQNVITLTKEGFTPKTLTVKKNTKVTFVNKSGATATVNSVPHPVHTSYPPLNLGSFQDGETLSLTFDKTGTYGYHNHLNPGQNGRIVVE